MDSNSDEKGPPVIGLLNNLWKMFEDKIETEGLEHSKGHLMAAAFALCINIGVLVSLSEPVLSNGPISESVVVIVVALLAAIPVLLLFIWVIIAAYKFVYKESVDAMRRILTYQTAVLLIAILVAIPLSSVLVAAGGIIVFGLLAVAYPLVKPGKGAGT